MFNELKTMRWLAPSVPAPKLLESATRVGAEALGLGDELGTIEVDKLAQLIAIDLSVSSPAGARSPASPDGNIEEYLVNGVDPRQIRWVTE
jgi:cytosine/adenosine deaminase-related metal-dependent hydrolase